MSRESPGGPAARTPPLTAKGMGSIPSQGTKILQAIRCRQKKEEEEEEEEKKPTLQSNWRIEHTCVHTPLQFNGI